MNNFGIIEMDFILFLFIYYIYYVLNYEISVLMKMLEIIVVILFGFWLIY